jgi:chromatin remodeling complex protein RSC6
MTDSESITEVGAAPAAPNSILDSIREQHKRMTSDHSLMEAIPGYDSLYVKYRLLTVDGDIKRISNKINREYKDDIDRAFYSAIDALVASCEGFYYYDGEQFHPLAESFGPDEPPVLYGPRMAEFLGVEANTAREVVKAVFGYNEPAILQHAQVVTGWMAGTTQNANNEFMASLGERP